ncbi:MAG: hypothetical protein ABI948_10140 [Thermoleophilia bacterium]
MTFILCGAFFAAGTTNALSATATQSFRTFADGTHAVGKDIPPGTYRTRGGNGCYWARLRSFGGGLNAIIANDNAQGPAVVTISRTDRGFETARCGTWTSNLARITKSKTRFGEGTYIVGTDITPGTYRARGSGCYWARLRSFGGGLNSIIVNDNTTGSTIVTISRRDKGFQSSRCGTWTRL